MRNARSLLVLAAWSVLAMSAHGSALEGPVELDAAALLGTEVLVGPHHRIESRVLNDGRTNRFRVGDGSHAIDAVGNRLAIERAREFQAIAALNRIKETDAYAKGLEAAANATLTLTRGVIEDPVGALSRLPQGLGTLLSDLGAAVQGVGRGKDAPREDNALVKDLIGFNTLKRRLAHEMKVDPYSTHPRLKTALNDVAWAMFAGGAPIELAITAAPAGLALALRAADRAEGGMLDWKIPPATVRQAMEREVLALGLDSREAEALIYHRTCTLRHLSLLVSAIVDLKPAQGRVDMLRQAIRANDEHGCRQAMHAAELAWSYHRHVTPVVGISVRDGGLWLRDREGVTVLVLPADHLAWTAANAALFAPGNAPRVLWLDGTVSPNTRDALLALGINAQDHVLTRFPGGLNVAAILLPERNTAQPDPAGTNRTGTMIERVGAGVGSAVDGVLQGIGITPRRAEEDARR